MDNAVSNCQRGCDEPVSVRGDRCILAEVQHQFGQHGALDFVKVSFLCRLGNRPPQAIAVAGMVRRAGPESRANLGSFMPMLPMQPTVPDRPHGETEFPVVSKN